MKDTFLRTYQKKSNEELEKIIEDKANYTIQAREAAIDLLKERSGDSTKLAEIEADIVVTKKRQLESKKKQLGEGDLLNLTEDGPHLFSETVVILVSIFLSNLFGGILMYMNLLSLGKKQAANLALSFGIASLVLAVVLSFFLPEKYNNLIYLLNIIGAAVYSRYFWKTHIGNQTAYFRKPWLAVVFGMIVALIAFGFLLGVMSIFWQ